MGDQLRPNKIIISSLNKINNNKLSARGKKTSYQTAREIPDSLKAALGRGNLALDSWSLLKNSVPGLAACWLNLLLAETFSRFWMMNGNISPEGCHICSIYFLPNELVRLCLISRRISLCISSNLGVKEQKLMICKIHPAKKVFEHLRYFVSKNLY